MTNWKTYKLGDVISDFIDYRGKTPPKVSYGIPLITAKVVKGGVINEPNEFVPASIYDKWMTRGIPEFGDVLLTTEAPLGEVAILKTKEKVVVGQRLITLRGKKNLLDNTFLKYSLLTNEMQGRLLAVSTGTTVVGIKSAELKKVEIELPDLPTQLKIAGILSALDDKIELNRRMNQTLEQMAQTLFRKYFVDGIDVNNLPEGWRVGTIGDLFILQRGFDLPSTKRAGGNVPIFSASGLNGFHNEVMVKGPGITTGRSGIIGNVYYVEEDFWPLNTSLFIKEFKASTPFHSFYVLKHTDLKGLNTGSAVPTLNRNDVHSLEAIIPDRKTVLDFEEKVKLLFNKIRQNEKENQSLTNLRDTLLPKLMSGEIDVMQTHTAGHYEEVLS